MVTTMALVWTVNSMLSWGCKISEFHVFAPPHATPCTVPPEADAPFPPPLAVQHSTNNVQLFSAELIGADNDKAVNFLQASQDLQNSQI